MNTASFKITAQPLTHEVFRPFGEVLEASEAVPHYLINAGNTERYHDLTRLEPGPDGHLIASIFRGQPRALPFTVVMMERHPLSSQTFMPLSDRPYLVVVAAPGTVPTASGLHVFLAQGNQGVTYAKGVWHHPLLALAEVSDFLVLDRSGPGANCDEILLTPPALISIASA